MSRRIGRLVVGIAVAAAVLALGRAEVAARAQRDCLYPFEQVYASALRFLRVDRGYRVKDKDREAGFILFEFKDGDKRETGSLELVRLPDGHPDGVLRLVATIANQPSYVEAHLLDALEKKLKAELGDPPPRKVRPRERDKDGGGP
jgi:hypothetical protein